MGNIENISNFNFAETYNEAYDDDKSSCHYNFINHNINKKIVTETNANENLDLKNTNLISTYHNSTSTSATTTTSSSTSLISNSLPILSSVLDQSNDNNNFFNSINSIN